MESGTQSRNTHQVAQMHGVFLGNMETLFSFWWSTCEPPEANGSLSGWMMLDFLLFGKTVSLT